jgi:hypothetical protein
MQRPLTSLGAEASGFHGDGLFKSPAVIGRMRTRACERLAVIGTPPYADQATPNSTPTTRTSSAATRLTGKPSWMSGEGFACLARRLLPCEARLPNMNEPG